MTRKLLLIIALLLIFVPLFRVFNKYEFPREATNKIAKYYTANTIRDHNIPNMVTGVVVGYRGFDTVGELIVLFLAVMGLQAVIKTNRDSVPRIIFTKASPILNGGTKIMYPFIFLFSIYIIIHGHLSPGGGFQGGAMLATGVLLNALCCGKQPAASVKYAEGASGFTVVLLGIISVLFLGYFMGNYMKFGHFGGLISGGILSVFYILIGMKVGTELSGLIGSYIGDK